MALCTLAICFLLVVVIMAAKTASSAYPIGCGILIVFIAIILIVTCNDMKREEQENKAFNERLEKNLQSETEYMKHRKSEETIRQELLEKMERDRKKQDE